MLPQLYDPSYEDAWIKQLEAGIDQTEKIKKKLNDDASINDREKKKFLAELEKIVKQQKKFVKEAEKRNENRRAARDEILKMIESLLR